MVDSGDGIYVTEYNYTTIAGTQTKAVQTTEGFGIIQIAAGGSSSDLNITNLSSWHVKFRNAYSA